MHVNSYYGIKVVSVEPNDVRIVERTSKGSTMYSIKANTEEEALHLFSVGSHLVKIVGSFSWK